MNHYLKQNRISFCLRSYNYKGITTCSLRNLREKRNLCKYFIQQWLFGLICQTVQEIGSVEWTKWMEDAIIDFLFLSFAR